MSEKRRICFDTKCDKDSMPYSAFCYEHSEGIIDPRCDTYFIETVFDLECRLVDLETKTKKGN